MRSILAIVFSVTLGASMSSPPFALYQRAALRSGAYRPEAGERVCVLASGANCDPSTVR
jgi:hypothetical protein